PDRRAAAGIDQDSLLVRLDENRRAETPVIRPRIAGPEQRHHDVRRRRRESRAYEQQRNSDRSQPSAEHLSSAFFTQRSATSRLARAAGALLPSTLLSTSPTASSATHRSWRPRQPRRRARS